jgi:hypothetical protein
MRAIKGAFVVFLCVCIGAAQESGKPATVRFPAGVHLPVALDDSIDVQSIRVGDTLTMSTTNNLLKPDKTVAIPKGAKARGHFTLVETVSSRGVSRLAFTIEAVEWPDGKAELMAEIAAAPAPSGAGTGQQRNLAPPVLPPLEQAQKASLASIPLIMGRYLELRVETNSDGTLLASNKDIRLPKGARLMLVTK